MTDTIFRALRYSGENFFGNKTELDQVRNESTQVCKTSKDKFWQFKNKNEVFRETINDQLFNAPEFQDTLKIKYDARRECTQEEENVIKKECIEKRIEKESLIEDVKYALGFKSNNQSNDEFKKPCVAVVGQTKAGKSSLINALLRGRVVPQKLTRQTARVTYVSYCETKFVAFMTNKKLTHIKIDVDVHDKDVDLKADERRRTENVEIEIRVGNPNEILRNGFDIVDSPGLNENPALNRLCKQMEESLLPLLIYVIDGRNGLTETDIGDIKNIRENTPDLKIIYFVTKLDRSSIDRAMYKKRKDGKKFKPNEDMDGESDIEVAQRRLQNVFNKLEFNAFVPGNVPFDECVEFNGANLAFIQAFRVLDKAPETEADRETVKLFEKFEKNLLYDLKSMIEEPLITHIQSLKMGIESILENTTSIAFDMVHEKQKKIQYLDKFKQNENELYEKEFNNIRERMKDSLKETLLNFEQKVIQFVDGNGNPDVQRYHNFSLQREIRELIEQRLQKEIEEFIARFMRDTDELLVQELRTLVERLNEGRSSFEEMLAHRLYFEYNLREECQIANSKDYSYQPARRSRMNRIFSDLREAFRNIRIGDHRNLDSMNIQPANHRSNSSARDIAREIFEEFDRTEFLDTIYSKVTSEIEISHRNFEQKLESERNWLQHNFAVDDKAKEILKEFSENMGILFTRIVVVKTNIKLVVDPTKQSEPFGKGKQAKLEKVYLMEPVMSSSNKSHTMIVKKTYQTVFKDYKDSRRAKSLGLEVYYSSGLHNSRLLQLFGIQKEVVADGFKLSSFYPYLPNGSLKDYLTAHKLDLKTRMMLAIHIAEGITNLHESKIIHRDITPKNILLMEESPGDLKAVIADFGVLNSLGFASSEYVGTPLYRPSELYNLQELESRGGYSFQTDVYSFGICLWQLLGYNLNVEYNNYYPQFVIDCEFDDEEIQKRVCKGIRPERRDRIPKELNDFMDRCWHEDISVRPSFLRPDTELLLTLSRSYSNTHMTITEYLQSIYDERI